MQLLTTLCIVAASVLGGILVMASSKNIYEGHSVCYNNSPYWNIYMKPENSCFSDCVDAECDVCKNKGSDDLNCKKCVNTCMDCLI